MEAVQEPIKNPCKLEFAIFCVENIATKLNISPEKTYDMLTKQSDILNRYIIANYEILHTQSKESIMENILAVIHKEIKI